MCPECKKLITAVKEWKKGCPECRKYPWLDLCPDCLGDITKQEDTCNDRHHKLYNVCIHCLKAACQAKAVYDNATSPNCYYTGCKNPIASKGCCGYPTGLCMDHNEALMKAIITHKSNCKAGCKKYPLLDLCPECLELINIQKDSHKDCIWKDTFYDIYVPCETCLANYEPLMNAITTHKSKCKETCKNCSPLKLCPKCLELINSQKDGHGDCIWKDTPYDVYVPCETCLACYACE